MGEHSHHSHQGHHHSHSSTNPRKLLAVAAIAWGLCAAQLFGSFLTGSLALLLDTVHVLTDALGVTVALIASRLALRPSTHRRTWGWKRVEIISAMFQASILLGVGALVIVEAVRRFFSPEPIASAEVLIFGVVGLIGNLVMIAILVGGDHQNFNMRAAFLEVVNDALGSVAVIVSAVVMSTTGWYGADAVVALCIGVLIVPRTLLLLRDTFEVLLESTPRNLDLQELQKHLESQEHVVAVHDLHVSQISSDLPVLTAHILLEEECFTSGHSVEILRHLQACVAEHFDVSIEHSTFQLEPESFGSEQHYRNLP
ncbi:cation diffusion facilitator family transporter [Rothia sp. P6271]|uniref:cation diffusion facilitator family transporter n=1 Tax=Rothia sp. P6271 TaxID=3402659 RepID=UPI003AD4E547